MRQVNTTVPDLFEIAQAVYQLVIGRHNGAGEAVLTPNETTTTVTNPVISRGSKIVLQAGPGTWSSTDMRVSAVDKGEFTITHSDEAATDRVVYWMIAGG